MSAITIDHPDGHIVHDTHGLIAVGVKTPAAEAKAATRPNQVAPRLLDPTLTLAADVVDDLERVRIANENRYRQLTRSVEDSDGEVRGFGLTEDHPNVAVMRSIVDDLAKIEHQAILALQRSMRAHPLGPWVKAQKGIGEKQAARLLATIGDPYLRPEMTCADGTIEPARPRTVSELWAYCGLHTLPVGHRGLDPQITHADGVTSMMGGDLRQDESAPPDRRAWVSARRTKGQRTNWSTTAKTRAWNVATSCIKQADSPYRAVYDQRRAATRERVHAAPCVRCGPSGKPAQPGTPWSAGHQHADALRIVSKAILRDLWIAARELYGDH